jgi:hypothetical protein
MELPNPYHLFEKKKSKHIENMENKNNTENTEKNEGSKHEKKLLLPFSIAFFILFILLAFAYFVYDKYYLYNQLVSIAYNSTNFWDTFRTKIISGKFSIFLFLWATIVLLNILIYDIVFQKKDTLNVFKMTTLFVFGILGTTFIIIGNIPSLVEVFENTLGYSVLNLPFLYGLSEKMKVFKSKHFQNSSYEIPFDILITSFDIPSFNDIYYSIQKSMDGKLPFASSEQDKQHNDIDMDFYIDYTQKNGGNIVENDISENIDKNIRDDLLQLTLVKNNVGHMTWTYIASVLSILLTMNSLL